MGVLTQQRDERTAGVTGAHDHGGSLRVGPGGTGHCGTPVWSACGIAMSASDLSLIDEEHPARHHFG
jgi:hypothetical protein